MSSVTREWSSGDDLEVEVPGGSRCWAAVVTRVTPDQLQLRLHDEPLLQKPLDAGTGVRLRRVSEQGVLAADAALAQAFVGRGPHLVLRRPTNSEIVQRRENFRMPTALPLTLQVKQATREDWVSRRVYHHLTADASGSGCSIETEIPLEPGDRLRVVLWPDRPHAVVAGARAVWTGPSDWPGLRRVGLAFTTISTTGQDRLVGTLLEEERVRRRVLADF